MHAGKPSIDWDHVQDITGSANQSIHSVNNTNIRSSKEIEIRRLTIGQEHIPKGTCFCVCTLLNL